MTCLLAFDSFKGCISAQEACDAARRGILSAQDVHVVSAPLSDGGEGIVDCFLRCANLIPVQTQAHSPLMEPVTATYALSRDKSTAYMEMAATCGLHLVPPHRRNPLTATTYGLGEMMLHALSLGTRHIVLGIGGSATCDAGQGMLQALEQNSLEGIKLTVACDVDNPLYGPNGAAYIYAPQKGATPSQVEELDFRLHQFARQTEELGLATPADAHRPGAGAAGGLGYTLLTHLHAELRPGIEVMFHAYDFDALIQKADYVFTGEGCSDLQTLRGKVASGVLECAHRYGVKVVLVSGHVDDRPALLAHGFDYIYDMSADDHRPLATRMRPHVAKEQLAQTCRRAMEDIL